MRRTVVAVLLGLSALAYAQGQQDTRFTLVCHYGAPDVGYRDGNFVIDLNQMTVNSQIALITEGEIRWHYLSETTLQETYINRYTGTMTITRTDNATHRVMAVINGVCARATERKF